MRTFSHIAKWRRRKQKVEEEFGQTKPQKPLQTMQMIGDVTHLPYTWKKANAIIA